MFRDVRIEQTGDGRWAVVEETIDSGRIVLRLFENIDDARRFASAS